MSNTAQDTAQDAALFSVQDAAQHLGLSVEALRARIKRKTIPVVRKKGRVYVKLDTAQDAQIEDISAPTPPVTETEGATISREAFVAILASHQREVETLREAIGRMEQDLGKWQDRYSNLEEAHAADVREAERLRQQDMTRLETRHERLVDAIIDQYERRLAEAEKRQNQLLHLSDRMSERVKALPAGYTVKGQGYSFTEQVRRPEA